MEENAQAPANDASKPDVQNDSNLLHKDSPIPHLRTLESDIKNAVKEQNASATIIAARQQQKDIQKKEVAHKMPKIALSPIFVQNLVTLAISLILIISSIVIFIVFFSILRPSAKVIPPTLPNDSIIAVESVTEVPLQQNQNALDALFIQNPYLTGTNGSITQIKFMATSTSANNKVISTPIDAQTFTQDLHTNIPDSLLRTLQNPYISGFYNDQDTWQPFLLYSISSYETAYPGMLTWENTLAGDLAKFYGGSGGSYSFKDSVINNKDVRVLTASDGNEVLYYSFPTKKTLIITPSITALKELFTRLQTSQYSQ